MLAPLTEGIMYRFSYPVVAGLTTGWFLLLYFGVGTLYIQLASLLYRRGYLSRIVPGTASRKQTLFELRHSLLSIFLFGLSALPLVWLVRHGHMTVLPDTAWHVAWGLVVLTLWNEWHFFVIHRLMHTRWCMRHIHYVHHKSRVPTIWSVFSFHPAEAVLLSTVPLTIATWLPMAPLAIILFPLVSILLNFAGHSNFRSGDGSGSKWKTFATRHAGHHAGTHRGYGFASHLPDRWWTRQNENLNNHE